ncbi:hypothetical protein GCM10023091_11820 [Ravibacter arvi]|uniref:Chromosome segregation protein SMC n=1 Tax=Ravibacter arvi TaxID=2051041 RepID=A0ABP8LS54_9BACT
MEKKSNSGILAALVIMTILAGVFAYLYYQEKQLSGKQTQDIQAKVTELAGMEMKLDSISRKLDEKIAEVEGLGGDLAELTKMKQQLEADRASLRKGNANLGGKIKEYETFLKQKDEEIAQLRQENQQLLSEKEELTTANQTLTQERATVRDSLSGALAKTEELAGKVHIASALKARNVKTYAVSSKGKVREGEKVKSKRVDKIRVDFMLEKNPLSETGTKLVYLRILDPNGATISDTGTGSGTFQYNGETHQYTYSKEVDYTNNNQDVSILYDRSGDFTSGNYAVQLFCEGFLIGEGTFSVR